jgi:hypothetical protein
MSSSLDGSGEVLNVSTEDVSRIKRMTRRRRIAVRTLGWLMPILSFGAGLFLSGAFRADALGQSPTYPLAAAAILTHPGAFAQRTRFMMVGTIVLSAVAFALGFVLGSAEPETTTTPRYGVLNRQGTGRWSD